MGGSNPPNLTQKKEGRRVPIIKKRGVEEVPFPPSVRSTTLNGVPTGLERE